MKVGLTIRGRLKGLPIQHHPGIVIKAEQLGFESCFGGEHLMFPAAFPSTYPYSASGQPPYDPTTPLHDTWVVYAFMAARTQRILLGTNVYILPLRHPFLTARAVTTLDVLSGGRVILGCGVGWLKEEFDMTGQGWKDRGGRTTEIVEILRKLWTRDTIEHHGKYYQFGPVKFEPKPSRQPGPPIYFGGESPAALRRAAQIGDGWLGTSHSMEELRGIVRTLNQLRREFGREKEPFEITASAGSPSPTLDDIRRFEEAGGTRVTVAPWPEVLTADSTAAALERFADKVLSRI